MPSHKRINKHLSNNQKKKPHQHLEHKHSVASNSTPASLATEAQPLSDSERKELERYRAMFSQSANHGGLFENGRSFYGHNSTGDVGRPSFWSNGGGGHAATTPNPALTTMAGCTIS